MREKLQNLTNEELDNVFILFLFCFVLLDVSVNLRINSLLYFLICIFSTLLHSCIYEWKFLIIWPKLLILTVHECQKKGVTSELKNSTLITSWVGFWLRLIRTFSLSRALAVSLSLSLSLSLFLSRFSFLSVVWCPTAVSPFESLKLQFKLWLQFRFRLWAWTETRAR